MNTELPVQHMPYAPPTGVIGVIRRFRDRGLAEPVTRDSLEQVGVSTGNAPRTLQALKFLGLVDDEGLITDTFKRLRQANTSEYPAALSEVLRNAYHPILNHVDPAQDDMTALEDAFRGFEPGGQRPRMVTLFLGLGHEAGIVPDDKAPKMSSQPRKQRPSQRPTGQRAKSASRTPPVEEPLRRETEDVAPDYHVVQAIVKQLPKNGSWTEKRRNLWVQAMTSAVDLAVEIEEPEVVYEGEVMPDLELE